MNKRQGVYLALLILSAFSYLLGPHVGTVSLAMAATVISGDRVSATGASQADIGNTRVVDMSDIIHMLEPNAAPLTAIMGKLRKTHCINPKVEWMEDEFLPSADTSADTATSAATAVFVTNIGYFRAGDVIKVLNTGETMYCSSLNGTTNIVCSRGIGATTKAQIDKAANLLIIGNSNAEFARGRVVKTTQKVPQYNFCQIFRTPYGASETLQNSELYGGDDLSFQARKTMIEHRIQMEAAFLFGERHTSEYDLATAAGIRFCGGIVEKISTNHTHEATGTMVLLETFLRDGTRYGQTTKVLFCSRLMASHINLLATTKIQTVPATKSFPLALSEYISTHGKFYIVTHNQLTGAVGTDKKYGGYGLLLDIESLWMRYLQNRDTKLKRNIQENDEDGRRDEYITEACPMVIHERYHSLWTDWNGYA